MSNYYVLKPEGNCVPLGADINIIITYDHNFAVTGTYQSLFPSFVV
jgi:hypothetical protein